MSAATEPLYSFIIVIYDLSPTYIENGRIDHFRDLLRYYTYLQNM